MEKKEKNKSIQDKSIQKILLQLRKDFSFLKPKVDKGEIHVLLYGSYARGTQTKQSDIDICIVAPKYKTPKQRAKLIKQIWRKLEKPYDVRIFETFPLYLKIDIINNHKVVYSKNYPELTYYFYFYRKLWQDQAISRLKE
jgi:predicted nucleotidyltransferase